MSARERPRDCAHHPRCGGCPLMSLDRPAQAAFKRDRLVSALARYRSLRDREVEDIREAPTFEGYRTRLKWMSDREGSLGLYATGEDHVVVDATDCRVAAPVPKRIAGVIRALLGSHPEVRCRLQAIDVREVDDAKALVTLVFRENERPSSERLALFVDALGSLCPEVVGIAENELPRGALQVLGPRTRLLRGTEEARSTVGDIHVLATFGSFVQAHGAQAAHLQAELVERILALREGDPVRVLELFAGSAPFGLALARHGAAVTAVESFEPAARRIERAAREQNLAIEARAEDATRLVSAASRGEFDVVLVDPPRRGLSRALRRAIVELAPKMIAYVSCDPDTLARDLADFLSQGYVPDRLRPLDMMPHTREVETLTYLFPGPRPPERVHYSSNMGRVVEDSAGESLTSGLLLEGRPGATRIEVDVLAKGVTHGKGRLFSEGGYEARYRRVAVVGGHSEARVTLIPASGTKRRSPYGALLRAFARIGHPVLGDSRGCDAATLRFMEERCGVDRPMIDTCSIELTDGTRFTTERAGDFVLALARLGADSG